MLLTLIALLLGVGVILLFVPFLLVQIAGGLLVAFAVILIIIAIRVACQIMRPSD